MAISPPGDIVLDVVNAADPGAVETARARLASMANRAGDGLSFSVDSAGSTTRSTNGTTAPSSEAFTKFEAMVLQSFFQSMLPSETSSVYGEGLSGEMWQNLLAEQLGNAVANSGGIGIADRILRDYYVAGEQRIPMQGVSSYDPEKPGRDTERMLSVALVQELQRKAAQSLSQETASTASNANSR